MTKRALVLVVFLLSALRIDAASPVAYRFSFPEPQHRWMQVDASFTELAAAPLELRMSRSSPGRYSLHDFAKNVYDVHAFAADGRELPTTRPDPYGWTVAGHDGSVTLKYKVFGDRVDGTYLGIDTTHAHINMPAAIMWARGLDDRPARVTFVQPAGMKWQVATQLHPGPSPLEFTAPNLQYLMDSPSEFGPVTIRQFTVGSRTFRFSLHHTGTEAELDAYMKDVEKIVRQQGTIYGEYPDYEPGTYTFLADYLPWANGDGMEHRNSTVITSSGSIAAAHRDLLETVSHEFFHGWNVERIRPKGLEPFDFDRANISGELWLAEGFTQYYGPLTLQRAQIASVAESAQAFSRSDRSGGAEPGASGPIGGGDEPDGDVHRRRPHRRSHQLVEHHHFLLSVRRGDCARARPDAARQERRQPLARRLHARDVAQVTASLAAAAKATSTAPIRSTMRRRRWRK